MLTNQQQQMLQSSHLLNQASQSFPHSTNPLSQSIINTVIPNDTIKQAIPPPPPSSSTTTTTTTATIIPSTTTETIENSHLSISPSPTPLSVPHTSEGIQPSIPSDTQPQVRSKIKSN
jgi:hypothetical protein